MGGERSGKEVGGDKEPAAGGCGGAASWLFSGGRGDSYHWCASRDTWRAARSTAAAAGRCAEGARRGDDNVGYSESPIVGRKLKLKAKFESGS